jgi:UrcA family protein
MKKLLVLAALLAAPLAAHAEPAKVLRFEVSTAGLDLRNPADAAVMIRRIEAAVRPACTSPTPLHPTTTACLRTLTRDAVKNLRIPELSVAFEHRSAPVAPVARG